MTTPREHEQPMWRDIPPDVHLELRSDPRYLSGARELVAAIARRLGFSETTCCQIALAVDEALANVICHGYERREDGRIWLHLWPLQADDGGGLRVVIEDEGKQVEIDQIRSRDLDDIRPGGLGVHIIREVMDETVYEKRTGGGMRLTLVKHAEPREGASPAASQDCPCEGQRSEGGADAER